MLSWFKEKLTDQKFILGLSLVFLFIICLYPFLTLFKKVIFSGVNSSLSFLPFEKIIKSKSTLSAIKNTALISILTGIFSCLLAIPLSWLFTRSNLKTATKWRSLFCLPYAIPPYIGAIAWIYMANPSNGILNHFFNFNIYSHSGLIFVMSTFFYTYILLSLLAALDRMDPSLEEAARLSGAGPFRVFFDITLPIIRPALISGILLVVLAASASFGVPAMIGNPASIYLITTKIYTLQKMGSMSGIYQAGALSIILLLLAIFVLYFNQKILNKDHFKTVSGKTTRPSLISLGKYEIIINFVLSIMFIILFVLPVSGILITALSKVQGELSFSNFGFQNFKKIFFEVNETPRAILNSFKLAFGAASFTCLLGLLLSYIQIKTRIKGRKFIEIIASIPYAAPGTVIALAFILTFSQSFIGLPISLYNTLFLIGLCYVAKYLNFATRTTADGLGQIDDSLAEAARVSGASWWISVKTIWFPLLKPALVASWFLVFMPAFSELTMTILLSGPGLETLGTLIFQLQEYADVSGGGAAVLALITIVMVALINSLIKIISKGKYGL